jgi:hypothetical protein
MLDQTHRVEPRPIQTHGHAALEADGVCRRLLRLAERALREHPGVIRDAAGRSQRLFAADRHAPQPAIHGIGGTVRRDRELALFQVFQLLGALERAVAHGREDRQLRRERAQRDFEPHLIVAGGGAAVSHDLGAELACVFGDRLRLHHALSADAQRIHLAALHVAHDQELDHLIEVRLLRGDEDVILSAELASALLQHLGRLCIDAAGVDRDRDDRTVVRRTQPRHQERRVQAAGECEEIGSLPAGRAASLMLRFRRCRAGARAACAARDRLRWR